MPNDLSLLDATAQAELVRDGHASPSELVEAAIARIERVDADLNAVIHRRFDLARAEAAGELPDGPFRGVPLVIKDFMCHSAGDPFHEGMAFLQQRSWVESNDTELAARFRAAGFIVVGRTNTPELALLPTTEPAAYGATHNPWDSLRSPGGSSGGSAAAVASGMVPVGHGNDAGGSIRVPASACGLVGLKPSRGRVSNGPDFGDVMGGLVAEHVLTRSVRDTAAVLDAVHGMAPGDPFTAPAPVRPYLTEVGWDPGRLSIGMMSTAPGGDVAVHPSCVAAVEAAGHLLESLGHTVEAAHPTALDDGAHVTHFVTVYAAGTAWALDRWSRKTGDAIGPDDVEPLTWALAELGRAASSADMLTAREWLQGHSRAIAAWYHAGFDLLLTPTIAEPPPLLGEMDSAADNPLQGLFRAAAIVPFTAPFNSTGQPAVSLPLHWDESGLPIGVQLVAPYGREDVLLRIAAQLEQAQPWAAALPPVHVMSSG